MEINTYLNNALKTLLEEGEIEVDFVPILNTDTKLPEYLYYNPVVTLKLSNKYKYPIEVTEEHIKASLSFPEIGYFDVIVPINTILGVRSPITDTEIEIVERVQDLHDLVELCSSMPEEDTDMSKTDYDTFFSKLQALWFAKHPEKNDKVEILLDRTKELGLEVYEGEGKLTPSVRGHLRLLH